MATIRNAFVYKIIVSEELPPAIVQDGRIIDIDLHIGNVILDVWYDACYIMVCTTSGVECLNSRTFGSIWYFDSNIVSTVCSNRDKVCFGTISSGIYYDDFPCLVGYLTDFLPGCKRVSNLVASGVSDMCVVSGGFFSGGDSGIDYLENYGTNELRVNCQLVCSGVNSVAYSFDTSTYYWSTVTTAYCSDTYGPFVIKSTATPGCIINSINVENINGNDVLYINTANGIIREFSLTCTGTIGNENIVSSDYESGDCGSEKVFAGYDNKLIEINTASGIVDTFTLSGTVSDILCYSW